jgi:hypothetical protein
MKIFNPKVFGGIVIVSRKEKFKWWAYWPFFEDEFHG